MDIFTGDETMESATTKQRVLVKSTRATAIELDTVEKGKDWITNQKEKHGSACPSYRLVLQTINITEQEIPL